MDAIHVHYPEYNPPLPHDRSVKMALEFFFSLMLEPKGRQLASMLMRRQYGVHWESLIDIFYGDLPFHKMPLNPLNAIEHIVRHANSQLKLIGLYVGRSGGMYRLEELCRKSPHRNSNTALNTQTRMSGKSITSTSIPTEMGGQAGG